VIPIIDNFIAKPRASI